ncbi:hypothetical protein [Christiangramia echinicola]|uniref:Uncharacterized protein n=1 Tax=Christiangramia echinicola TaxID=279359 RepID=A0A1H1LCJ0_9FLAO|nr:hypothetical protein [Christiangramia echinicola]SDR71745.1 hypothetical protein SAMN04488552_0680 [Christiangramia echinicola]
MNSLKHNLILALIVIFISSCSTNDNNQNESKEISNFYKKTTLIRDSEISSFQEVFYNADNKIENVVTSIDDNWKVSTIEIEYDQGEISIISKRVEYDDSYSDNETNTFEEFEVFQGYEEIILKGINNTEKSIRIEFTGNYVDLIDIFSHSNERLEYYTFKRNSENNIVFFSDENIDFNYSNFDQGNVLPLHREYSIDYLLAFGLKPSKKLPLTQESIHSSGGNSQESTMDSSLFSYDQNDNIIKYGHNENYWEYTYIDL